MFLFWKRLSTCAALFDHQMEAEDLVEHKDNFAAPPTGSINELQDVGNEDEIEGQVSNRNN